ncbi:TPA: fused PTS fructose transporter subunit IIA/HPr protein [Pasteurella multocida]|uniref:fused PTS fructose transporter subunit IIA/HPr protein n=1 Tax=Pasteurella multocida TaxID=747 RepID=UPI0028DEB130|nr:fused PTS fructose transporter subunit IIA/HPr protein [Pasteurella multocida]MDY0499533.1 fused PTS fructose transporter subunit IIA/HPr protein [Pasteurella multocida]MDY0655284.1 fused PTS fructose transporter subunit IIA/HPr protein [Pasteurella multocida]WRU39662.1 fused PTS fructose transporter subunit IIA/HPr protein [Pasteurella multocida]HDR1919603.1 fused PTS fructose transporter subunit IIA/HPr protein [Pasteurella multocida]HEA3244019.1 fused PTS fructose transporter subunit IIA
MFELTENDIHLSSQAVNKDQAIEMVAQALIQSGYVEEGYLAGMLEREAQITTYLGNGIAIPHGSVTTRALVKKTGVKIFQFPQGVAWDKDNIAYLVIGLAADSDGHLALLRQLARLLHDKETVKHLITTQDVSEFYARLMGKSATNQPDLISLDLDTTSLLTLTARNAEKLQQYQAVNNEFVREVLASPALPLGQGIWLTDATLGNQKNACAFSRAKNPFLHNSKSVHAVLTIAAIDDNIHPVLTRLLAPEVQQQLLTGSKETIASLLNLEHKHVNQTEGTAGLNEQIEPIEAIFTLRNLHGLHARPAAILVSHLKKYNASIAVQNLTTNSQLISAKSLLKVIALGAQQGHRLRFVATGAEAQQAIQCVGELIDNHLGETA